MNRSRGVGPKFHITLRRIVLFFIVPAISIVPASSQKAAQVFIGTSAQSPDKKQSKNGVKHRLKHPNPNSATVSLPSSGSDTPTGQAKPPADKADSPVQMPLMNELNEKLRQDPLMRSVEPRPVPPVPAVVRVGVQPGEILALSLKDAVLRALENNNDIEVSKDNVRINEGTLLSLEGVFDPVFNFNPQFTHSTTPTSSSIGGAGSSGTVTQSGLQFNSSVIRQFAKGGGQYQLFFNNLRQSSNSTTARLNPFYSSSFGANFAQPLLRNRSIDSYRRDLRIQRRKVEQSDADFRLLTTQIIDQVQHTYWELSFNLHSQQVAIDSLNLAREQFRATEQGVAAGTSAPLRRAEVETQIATAESNLLAAAKSVTTTENTFKQLILRDPASPEWRAAIYPTDEPSFDLTPVGLDDALAEALANRPELRRLRVQEEIDKITLQYARNQLLPRVDIVSTLSSLGLAGSEVSQTPFDLNAQTAGVQIVNGQVPLISGNPSSQANAFLLSQVNQLRAAQGLQSAQVPLITALHVAPQLVGGYGQTLRNLFSFRTRSVVIGLTIDIPFHNRTARGNLVTALAQSDQLLASIHSEQQAVETDVRNALQALETARQTVLTERQAVHSAELLLAGEQQLFRVGQSTLFLVFQRENALATARNTELRAEADFNNALADLDRATGASLRTNNVVIEPTVKP